eukprot:356968-Chlamydomonas_euryale.AAC.21
MSLQPNKCSVRRAILPRRHSMLTLADGALHVAHDEAVLVVQKLDADLGNLLEQVRDTGETQAEENPEAIPAMAS